MDSAVLTLHIGGGAIGILTGMAALFAAKGKGAHARLGRWFFMAMLVMAISAGILAAKLSSSALLIIAGITCYLMSTSLMTVAGKPGTITRFDKGACVMGLIIALSAFGFGFEAIGSEITRKGDFPAPPFFFFGAVASIAVMGDLRMIRKGGLTGKARIGRHLWRICFVLFVATTSFFLGNSHVFEGIVSKKFLSIPVLLVVVSWLYWSVRVKYTGWHNKVRASFKARVSRRAELAA